MSSVMRITEADERAQRDIENDIDRHLQAVVQLRRRFNLFARINRFPLEILTEILYFCQDGPWTTKSQDESKYGCIPAPLRWIVILRVCHHWRNIALQTPRMWSRINLDHPTFARECSLVRAKRFPLDLTVKRWDPSHSGLFDELALEMDRIKSIDMCLTLRSNRGSSKPVPSATSALTSLRISSQYGVSPQLPMMFENCRFPAIRTLELGGHVAKFPSSLLGSTLTQLTLSTESHLVIDPVAFSHHLSQMSQLELLHLQGICFREKATKLSATTFTQKVRLPTLRRLIVQPPRNAQSDYTSLLDNLDVPPLSQVRLSFIHKMPDEDLSTLCHAALALLRPFIFHSLAFYDSYSSFIIGLWEDPVEPDVLDGVPNVPYTISLPPAAQAQRPLWEGLLHVLDLNSIKIILQFEDLHILTKVQEDWKRLIRTCRHLQDLCLKAQSAHMSVKLLLENEESNSDDQTPIVPELKAIHFRDVVWCTLQERQDGRDGELTQDLAAIIEDRIGADCPLEKVIIKTCVNMNEDDVESLRDCGVKVEWDGYIDYEEEESEEEEEYFDDYDVYDAFPIYDDDYYNGYW